MSKLAFSWLVGIGAVSFISAIVYYARFGNQPYGWFLISHALVGVLVVIWGSYGLVVLDED